MDNLISGSITQRWVRGKGKCSIQYGVYFTVHQVTPVESYRFRKGLHIFTEVHKDTPDVYLIISLYLQEMNDIFDPVRKKGWRSVASISKRIKHLGRMWWRLWPHRFLFAERVQHSFDINTRTAQTSSGSNGISNISLKALKNRKSGKKRKGWRDLYTSRAMGIRSAGWLPSTTRVKWMTVSQSRIS